MISYFSQSNKQHNWHRYVPHTLRMLQLWKSLKEPMFIMMRFALAMTVSSEQSMGSALVAFLEFR